MITSLKVQNLAIIENIFVQFNAGFTVLTGETGAGKSLLVDALSLALGSRADADQVRTGEHRAIIELEFNAKERPEILEKASEFSIPVEGNVLKISREVTLTGRSQAKINGQTVTLADLRELSRLMIDLHGQHSHQALLDPKQHLAFYDAWIGQPAEELKQAVEVRYKELNQAKRRLEAIGKGRRDYERRLDNLRYEIKEIESTAPIAGEFESLELNLDRLKNAGKIFEGISASLNSISGEELSAESQIASAVSSLATLAKFDPELEEIVESLREYQYFIQELSGRLHDYQEQLEADPRLLEDTARRMDQLQGLRRKYGENEAEILAHLEEARLELADLESYDGNEDSLLEKVDELTEAYEKLAEELSFLRKAKANDFCHEIEAHLADLALEKASFEVGITPAEPAITGMDRIEFMFSANPGESMKPLSKTASGGEMSRTMLALKAALAGKAGVPTLIFDEIDAGLSGKAAQATGKKLRGLGQFYQVLVISHLPQTAAQAQSHFLIEKREAEGRSQTHITRLDLDDRTAAIAKMMDGEVASKTALVHAAELLKAN